MPDFVSKNKPSVSFTATEDGAVPNPGTASGTKFLRDDGTWQTVAGSGFDENTILTSQDGAVIVNQNGNVLVTG